MVEIQLLSYGFENAVSLTVQICCVFELCRRQISRKPHYDFGTRAIQNILHLCKKQASTNSKSEQQIVYDIIRSVVLPILTDADSGIFYVRRPRGELLQENIEFNSCNS